MSHWFHSTDRRDWTNISFGCECVARYFIESESLTGPFRLVSYWQAFGPQAYFVGLPSAFTAKEISVDENETTALEVTLSYSANFHPAGPNNPPGPTGGWNLRKARLVVAPGHD